MREHPAEVQERGLPAVALKAALQPALAYGLGLAFGLQDRQLLAVTLTAVATAPLLLAPPVLLR